MEDCDLNALHLVSMNDECSLGCTKVTYDVELKAISLDIAVYG